MTPECTEWASVGQFAALMAITMVTFMLSAFCGWCFAAFVDRWTHRR